MIKLFQNILLVGIAIILFIISSIVAIPFTLIKLIIKPRMLIKTISNVLFATAKSIDQFGNAVYFVFLNAFLIKKDEVYPFGDETETISKVLGINKEANNLTKLGELLGSILNKIDPYHLEDAVAEDTNFC